MNIYKEMLSNVRKKLNECIPLLKYLRMSEDELCSQISKLTKYEADMLRGFAMYSLGIVNWFPAEKINEPIDCDNTAEYMLRGRFKTACENGEILDDTTMKKINIDVHNRVYTLVENKLI